MQKGRSSYYCGLFDLIELETKIYIEDNNLEFEEVIDRDGKHFSFSIPIFYNIKNI